jgi:hypothetical protein
MGMINTTCLRDVTIVARGGTAAASRSICPGQAVVRFDRLSLKSTTKSYCLYLSPPLAVVPVNGRDVGILRAQKDALVIHRLQKFGKKNLLKVFFLYYFIAVRNAALNIPRPAPVKKVHRTRALSPNPMRR